MTKSWIETLVVLALFFPLKALPSSAEHSSERLQPLVRASAERIDLAREVSGLRLGSRGKGSDIAGFVRSGVAAHWVVPPF
jgi:hypothetical protein